MIRRPQFERLWDDSDDAGRQELTVLIAEGRRIKVADWIRQHPSLELGEKKLSVLKDIATRFGITNVSRMGKLQLVKAITRREKHGTQ